MQRSNVVVPYLVTYRMLLFVVMIFVINCSIVATEVVTTNPHYAKADDASSTREAKSEKINEAKSAGVDMPFQLTTKAFKPSEMIPSKYSCDGADVSPDLKWENAPEGTKGFALICDDPDAPVGTFTHWVLYGLAHDTTELPEGLTKNPEVGNPKCKQGINDFGRVGYGGPYPPRGASLYRGHQGSHQLPGVCPTGLLQLE